MVLESEPIVRILAEIDEEHKAVTTLIATMSIDQLSARKRGQWSAIDLLAHLTVWQAHAVTIARQQAAPDAPMLDPAVGPSRVLSIETDTHNMETLAAHRDLTLDRVLAWYNQVHADLRSALTVLSSERLLGGPGPHGAQMWYARPALLHSRDHRREFQERLARI